MKIDIPSGKVYFFKSDKSSNPRDCFTPLLEVNSNFDNLKSIHLGNGMAFGITTNNELLEWEFNKKQIGKENLSSFEDKSEAQTKKIQNKKNEFLFLLSKPSYRFHKLKIKSIRLNKTMCLSLDINGNVLVWGENKEGLLGLGYDVTSLETPTVLEGLTDITDISLSDFHAVALNSNGNAFSWGLGKYGELGLDKSIYSPVPQQMNTESIYSRVFCGNLITCFLDFEGHFSYYGVVIRQLGGNSSTITIKNLLNDQDNSDTNTIFLEKEIEELDDQKFKQIVIGNGFVALLSNKGVLYVLEYNDKLTILYNKYHLYNITISKHEIFGLACENENIKENVNNLNTEEKNKNKYYLCKWTSKTSSENEVCSDIWNTTIWKFRDEFNSTLDNCNLLDSNENRNILLLLDSDEKFIANLNATMLNSNKKNFDLSASNEDVSINNNTAFFDMMNLTKKKLPQKILEFEAEYDDSLNSKFKRTKSRRKNNQILKDMTYISTNRNKSISPFFNKSYNNGSNVDKINIGNIGNNNISAIGFNTSGFVNKKINVIPYNNAKRNNDKLLTHNFNAKSKNNNFIHSTKSSFSMNINELTKEMNNGKDDYKKDRESMNEDPIEIKDIELSKYKSELNDIISNYKNKQYSQKANLMNKYGLSREVNHSCHRKNPNESSGFNNANFLDSINSNNNIQFTSDNNNLSINKKSSDLNNLNLDDNKNKEEDEENNENGQENEIYIYHPQNQGNKDGRKPTNDFKKKNLIKKMYDANKEIINDIKGYFKQEEGNNINVNSSTIKDKKLNINSETDNINGENQIIENNNSDKNNNNFFKVDKNNKYLDKKNYKEIYKTNKIQLRSNLNGDINNKSKKNGTTLTNERNIYRQNISNDDDSKKIEKKVYQSKTYHVSNMEEANGKKDKEKNYLTLPIKLTDLKNIMKNKKDEGTAMYKNEKKNNKVFITKFQNMEINKNSSLGIVGRSRINSSKINKFKLKYFCELLNDYMKKIAYFMCLYEIAEFQKRYEKNLGLKVLHRVIKKRIIFYNIKFFHRFKKLGKFLQKFNKTRNILSAEKKQINRKKSKKK
jgi:hypothetical protein